ncbi:AtzH-like domain-containing protein [Poseidonocella sp. HB161398]|uniref:AtzH-like domain-containing protein n=1 Tax=Poseidonocella sp. HB161398 TaxID=2320855 RepID=UPI0011098DB6|nr:AtzH-like domain-containing protein [Poseidonocella sp. HB161398]
MEEVDRASTEAEIRAEFDAYEAALAANDVARLTGFFWEDPRAVRLAPGGGLYGHAEIAAFRRNRDVPDTARELSEVRITAFSADFGTATCEYRRLGSGRRGRQSQVWMRRPEGWRIVSAHVSLDP